jgi:hypothetical protein
MPVGRRSKRFRCRCCLLFWTGDYPAQAAISGTHSKTCHWCVHKSVAAPEATRRMWSGYRKYTPADDPVRAASARYGPVEADPPPAPRTHESFVEQGLANEAHNAKLRRLGKDARQHKVYKKDLPYKKTGHLYYIRVYACIHCILLA